MVSLFFVFKRLYQGRYASFPSKPKTKTRPLAISIQAHLFRQSARSRETAGLAALGSGALRVVEWMASGLTASEITRKGSLGKLCFLR